MDLLKEANLLLRNKDFVDYFNEYASNRYLDCYLMHWFLDEKNNESSMRLDIDLPNVINFIKTASSVSLEVEKKYDLHFNVDYFLNIMNTYYSEVKNKGKLGFILHNMLLFESCFFKVIEHNHKKIYSFGSIVLEEDLSEEHLKDLITFDGYKFAGSRCFYKETVLGSFLESMIDNRLDYNFNFLIEWLTINLLSAIDIYRLAGDKSLSFLFLSKKSGIYTELHVPIIYSKRKVMKLNDLYFDFNFEVIDYDVPFIFTVVPEKKNNEEVMNSIIENRHFFYIPTKDCLEIKDSDYILEDIDFSL